MGFDVYRLLDANLYQFNGDTSAKSILTSWLESNPYIKSIDQIVLWDYADKASATGSSRIVFYNNNPDYIDVAIPQEMVALPPQDRKLSIEVYMYSRYAGVRFKQSLAAVYLDGAV
jgi:hypothetical protein